MFLSTATVSHISWRTLVILNYWLWIESFMRVWSVHVFSLFCIALSGKLVLICSAGIKRILFLSSKQQNMTKVWNLKPEDGLRMCWKKRWTGEIVIRLLVNQYMKHSKLENCCAGQRSSSFCITVEPAVQWFPCESVWKWGVWVMINSKNSELKKIVN